MWQSPDFFIFRLFLLSKGLRRRAVADVGPLRVIRLSVDHPHAAHFIVIPDSFFQGLAVGVISRLSRLRCVNRRFSVADGFLRGSEYLETVCFIPCRFFPCHADGTVIHFHRLRCIHLLQLPQLPQFLCRMLSLSGKSVCKSVLLFSFSSFSTFLKMVFNNILLFPRKKVTYCFHIFCPYPLRLFLFGCSIDKEHTECT